MTVEEQLYLESCSIAAMQGMIIHTGLVDRTELAEQAWRLAKLMFNERHKFLVFDEIPKSENPDKKGGGGC